MNHLSRVDIFRAFAAGIHGEMAIALLVILYYCDVSRTSSASTIAVSNASLSSFMTDVLWDTDVELPYRNWNPYVAFYTLQWITSSFAVYYVKPGIPVVRAIAALWDLVGLLFLVTWFLVHPASNSAVSLFAYTACFVLTAASVGVADFVLDRMASTAKHTESDAVVEIMVNGRMWNTPVGGLSLDAPAHEGLDPVKDRLHVMVRYFEFAVTSPLALVAVYALFVVDGPMWVFGTCFWMMLVCSLMGAMLQYTTVMCGAKGSGFSDLFSRLTNIGSWSSTGASMAYYIQLGWITGLMSLGSVGYSCRHVLFDSPVVVMAILWLTFVCYGLFGLMPTAVYITGIESRVLSVAFDILNLVYKFPLAVCIIYGITSVPDSFQSCTA